MLMFCRVRFAQSPPLLKGIPVKSPLPPFEKGAKGGIWGFYFANHHLLAVAKYISLL